MQCDLPLRTPDSDTQEKFYFMRLFPWRRSRACPAMALKFRALGSSTEMRMPSDAKQGRLQRRPCFAVRAGYSVFSSSLYAKNRATEWLLLQKSYSAEVKAL
jgi:hypothetical protein